MIGLNCYIASVGKESMFFTYHWSKDAFVSFTTESFKYFFADDFFPKAKIVSRKVLPYFTFSCFLSKHQKYGIDNLDTHQTFDFSKGVILLPNLLP